MTEEKIGIKETKELFEAVGVLVEVLIERLKDGFAVEDLASILSKVAFDQKVREGLKDLKKLPAEMKDLDLDEGIELAMILVAKVPKYIEAAKK